MVRVNPSESIMCIELSLPSPAFTGWEWRIREAGLLSRCASGAAGGRALPKPWVGKALLSRPHVRKARPRHGVARISDASFLSHSLLSPSFRTLEKVILNPFWQKWTNCWQARYGNRTGFQG